MKRHARMHELQMNTVDIAAAAASDNSASEVYLQATTLIDCGDSVSTAAANVPLI